MGRLPKFLLLSSIAHLALIFVASCGSARPIPKWDGEFWAADHETGQVQVKKNGQVVKFISAVDPKFSDGAWVSYDDIGCLYQAFVNNCKEWQTLTPKCERSLESGQRIMKALGGK